MYQAKRRFSIDFFLDIQMIGRRLSFAGRQRRFFDARILPRVLRRLLRLLRYRHAITYATRFANAISRAIATVTARPDAALTPSIVFENNAPLPGLKARVKRLITHRVGWRRITLALMRTRRHMPLLATKTTADIRLTPYHKLMIARHFATLFTPIRLRRTYGSV